MKLFAHSRWDIVPVLAGVAHLAFVVWLYLHVTTMPWWQAALLGKGGQRHG